MRLSLAEKLLSDHLVCGRMAPGQEVGIRIDQAFVQDHSGPQSFLFFEAIGSEHILCDTAVIYSDHNVLQIKAENMEDHFYLQTAAARYGAWFAKPGIGISHQVHLEQFAIPGATILGADSHTPTLGSIGALAIGAGGMDVAAVLSGAPFLLKVPRVIAVRLNGRLAPWSAAKDVCLELLRRLTVSGARGTILEFVGPGVETLNIQQRATIANMCTELGATAGLFPSDHMTADFLHTVGRPHSFRDLQPDRNAEYTTTIDIDLDRIPPLIALPGSPDSVVPVEEVAGTEIHQVMLGSCTNGSFTDFSVAARLLSGRLVHPRVAFFAHPSSRQSIVTLSQTGLLTNLISSGVELSSPTCGACIGIGHVPSPGAKSLRTINRNFPGRSGQPSDSVYLCSAETATVSAIRGCITDPRSFSREEGVSPPEPLLPPAISHDRAGLVPPFPQVERINIPIRRGPNLIPPQLKPPMPDMITGTVSIKVGSNITTDHILPATPDSLAYRSNIPKISDFIFSRIDPDFALRARHSSISWVVAGHNFGQGSSREHAALALAHLGVQGVIAMSFARIHHANLINAGVLPLVLEPPADYNELDVGDTLIVTDLLRALGSGFMIIENQTKGMSFRVIIEATKRQLEVLKYGGLLAYIRSGLLTDSKTMS